MKFHLALLLFVSTPALASGPWVDKGRWLMNETTGSVVADSVGSLTGTAYNTTIILTPSCNASPACRSFNGTSSYIRMPYSVIFDPGNNDLRYSAWFRPVLPRPENGDDLIHVDGYPNQHFKLEVSDAGNTGKASCGVRGSANQTVSAAGGPDLYNGVWHHLECRVVHNPSNHLELWVDGVLVVTKNGSIGSIVTGTPMLLGKHSTDAAGWFTGRMDDVRIMWATP